MPSSATTTRAVAPSDSTRTETGFPSPYFRAFETRFVTTCSSRSRSQRPQTASAASTRMGERESSVSLPNRDTTSRTSAVTSTSSSCSWSRASFRRETSRSVFTRTVSRTACRRIASAVLAVGAGIVSRARKSDSTWSRSAVSGVFSSCDAIERNASRARTASESFVTSMNADTAPRERPWSSNSGSALPRTLRRVPSSKTISSSTPLRPRPGAGGRLGRQLLRRRAPCRPSARGSGSAGPRRSSIRSSRRRRGGARKPPGSR